MALIQVPSRRIRRDFKPDFPVRPRTDLLGKPTLLFVPQTRGTGVYVRGAWDGVADKTGTYPCYTVATPAGPAYYISAQNGSQVLSTHSNWVFPNGAPGMTVLTAYRWNQVGAATGWRQLFGVKTNQVINVEHASNGVMALSYGTNSVSASQANAQANITYLSAFTSGTKGSAIWAAGEQLVFSATENAILSGMNAGNANVGAGYDYGAPVSMLAIAVYQYQLSDNQIKAWMADPFGSLLRPAASPVWIPVGAGGGGTTVSADAGIPLESTALKRADTSLPTAWQRLIAADPGMPAAWLAAIQAITSLPDEVTALISADGAQAYESLAGVQIDTTSAIEWAQALGINAVIPLEWGGALLVFADSRIPVEWSAPVSADSRTPVDACALIAVDATLNAGWLRGVQVDTQIVHEALANLAASLNIPVEWRTGLTIVTDTPMLAEWTAAVDQRASLPVEWLSLGTPFIDGVTQVWYLDAKGNTWKLDSKPITWKLH